MLRDSPNAKLRACYKESVRRWRDKYVALSPAAQHAAGDGAFMGLDFMRESYALAIRERYRFYSFGDAMLIL